MRIGEHLGEKVKLPLGLVNYILEQDRYIDPKIDLAALYMNGDIEGVEGEEYACYETRTLGDLEDELWNLVRQLQVQENILVGMHFAFDETEWMVDGYSNQRLKEIKDNPESFLDSTFEIIKLPSDDISKEKVIEGLKQACDTFMTKEIEDYVGQFIEVDDLVNELVAAGYRDVDYGNISINSLGYLALLTYQDDEGKRYKAVVNCLSGNAIVESVEEYSIKTVEDVVEETGLRLWAYVFDPKYFGGEDNYRNIDEMLKTVGYELKDKKWIGEYGDYKGYKNCEVVKYEEN